MLRISSDPEDRNSAQFMVRYHEQWMQGFRWMRSYDRVQRHKHAIIAGVVPGALRPDPNMRGGTNAVQLVR